MTRIAINGFGRIGRAVLRLLGRQPDLEVVAINDLMDIDTLLHLLRYDSVHGKFEDAQAKGGNLVVGGKEIRVTAERDPAQLPWKELGVDIVLECTGLFRDNKTAGKHLEAGAKKVILSAPGKDIDGTFVGGVNLDTYDPATMHVVSNASCTTNCLAPMVKVLHEKYTMLAGTMTTIHSYTNDQRILDLPHKDLRRSRAAAVSMIPTTTGAARAIGLVIPELNGKIDGMAIRVPTPNVSIVDLVAKVAKKPASKDEVMAAYRTAAESGPLAGIMAASDEPLVSCDYNGSQVACTVDLSLTLVQDDLVKILGWYDNEMGYTARLVDFTQFVASKL